MVVVSRMKQVIAEMKWRYRVVDEGGSPRDEAIAVLEEALPKIIAGINFSKAMRWITNSDVTFSRPMRWLFAVHGDHHLSFEALGVPSGATTRLSCSDEPSGGGSTGSTCVGVSTLKERG